MEHRLCLYWAEVCMEVKTGCVVPRLSLSAPCPSAAVLARRASREVKPMREESGSDEDAEEPEEWENDDEEEGEGVEKGSW
tara:strand:+ start:395 stop:637 length:243 start_codon:yes stop_codon:yes gene_type:complete